jgi:uncharacterized protein (TIGR03905 family)
MQSYKPQGVCARRIDFRIDEQGCVRDVYFEQGCPGNAVGVARLAEGRDAAEVARLLADVPCGGKSTSCPAELSRALHQHLGSAD